LDQLGSDENGSDSDGNNINGFNSNEGLKLGYYLCDEDGNQIDYLSVLGRQPDNVYTLKITGESLLDGFNLEALDLTVDFESSIFNVDDFTISSNFAVTNAVDYVEEEGEIRFAAASLSDLDPTITSEYVGETDIQVITSVKHWTGATDGYDLRLHINSALENYNGVKSLTVARKNDSGEWEDIVTKSDESGLTGSQLWRVGTWNWNDELRFQSEYVDNEGIKHISNSYMNSGQPRINHTVYVDSYDSFANFTDTKTHVLGNGIGNETDVIASIKLDFNEDGLAALERNEDGSFVVNPFDFDITANLNDTVLSKDINDEEGSVINREILSLGQFGGDKFKVEGENVFLYEEKAALEETGDGFIISTERVIGADAAETNLVRAGDTLTASTTWINTGNTDLIITGVSGLDSTANATISSDDVTLEFSSGSLNSLSGGTFGADGFTASEEVLTLTADIIIASGEDIAGSVVDLSESILQVETEGFSNYVSGKGSKNLITYQGDLNYDGRVSMKDLAYLNAGAARFNSGGGVAGDVDANYDDSIDLLDLAVLDKDWGKSLHTGVDDFLGSNELSWEDLDSQGDKTWDNTVFKEQNAFEALEGFVGSLESPASSVIGADGNEVANDKDMLGTYFQETP
jgi:hypothetical protein